LCPLGQRPPAERGLGWTVVVTNLLAKARSEAGRLSLGGRLRQAGVAQVHGPVGWRLLGV
jgi:allophanate hydrolase subunit 1